MTYHDLEQVLSGLSPNQRVRAAIYAVSEVLPAGKVPAWDRWADDWLARRDRQWKTALLASWELDDALDDATWAGDVVDCVKREHCHRASALAILEAAKVAAVDLAAIVRRAVEDENALP